MQYDALTAEQKATLDAFMTLLRPWAGEAARANNHAQLIDDTYEASATGVIASLDAGAVVPNNTGLAGAMPLTKEEVLELVTDIKTLQAGFNTPAKRQLISKAAGAGNIVG